jgi:hypothetical protein
MGTTNPAVKKFDFINVQVKRDEHNFDITGEVKNLGKEEISEGGIRIAVAIKDSQGNVLDIDSTYNDFAMPPGQTSFFKLGFKEDIINRISDYELYTD